MNQICTNYLLNIVVSATKDDWTWKLQMEYAIGVKIKKMKCSKNSFETLLSILAERWKLELILILLKDNWSIKQPSYNSSLIIELLIFFSSVNKVLVLLLDLSFRVETCHVAVTTLLSTKEKFPLHSIKSAS